MSVIALKNTTFIMMFGVVALQGCMARDFGFARGQGNVSMLGQTPKTMEQNPTLETYAPGQNQQHYYQSDDDYTEYYHTINPSAGGQQLSYQPNHQLYYRDPGSTQAAEPTAQSMTVEENDSNFWMLYRY